MFKIVMHSTIHFILFVAIATLFILFVVDPLIVLLYIILIPTALFLFVSVFTNIAYYKVVREIIETMRKVDDLEKELVGYDFPQYAPQYKEISQYADELIPLYFKLKKFH